MRDRQICISRHMAAPLNSKPLRQLSLEAACNTISRLVDAKKSSECTVGVGYLIDNDSIAGMEDAMRVVGELGADYLQFRPVYLAPWFNGPASIDFKRYRAEYEKRHKYNYTITQSAVKFDKLERGDVDRKYSACHGQQFCAVVTSTGDVVLCCLLRGQPQFVLGNIHKESFDTIWNSEYRQHVIKNLNMDKDCPPLCRCDALNEMLEHLKELPNHVHFL